MREGCSCNAWIRATQRHVIRWRQEHACPDRPTPNDIHQLGGAQIEYGAHQPADGSDTTIGFQRE